MKRYISLLCALGVLPILTSCFTEERSKSAAVENAVENNTAAAVVPKSRMSEESKIIKEQVDTPLLAQPDHIPGDWDITTSQNFPPFELALSRSVPGRLVYGLYTWAGEYLTYRTDINDVGWPSIRIAGPFHDTIMTALAEDEVKTMYGVDNWILDPAKGANRPDYESDEAFISDYIAKTDAFISKYGPGGSFFKEHPELPNNEIVDIELWNEPNFQYMIPPDERPRPEVEADREKLYAKMLPQLYTTIKEKHPGVNVIAFATGGMSGGDLRFIQHVHELSSDIGPSYDTLSTHPYVRPAAPEANSVQPWGSYSISRSLNIIRDTVGKYGRSDVPIWYTEIGWPILPADGGFYDTHRPQECVTPLLQAAYVCRTYALALRLNVERVHIMYVTDADHFNAGFFDKETRKWRPAAHAAQTMIATMPNPKLIGAISDGVDGCYMYTYLADAEKGDVPANKTIMAWNVAGPKTVELVDLPGMVTVTDMIGATQTRATENGMLSIEIGPCPVYIKAMM